MNNHSTEQRRDLPRAIQILCGGAGTWTSFPTFLLWFSKRPRWFQSVDIAGFFLWPWSHISVQQSGTIFSASLFNFASVPVYLLSYRRLSISLRKFWLGRKKKGILPFVEDLQVLEQHGQIGTCDDSARFVQVIGKWPFCKSAMFLLHQISCWYIHKSLFSSRVSYLEICKTCSVFFVGYGNDELLFAISKISPLGKSRSSLHLVKFCCKQYS